MYAPPSLNVTVTLTFDLETPNLIGSSTSNDQPPYQVRRSLGFESQVIDRTRFVYGPTSKDQILSFPWVVFVHRFDSMSVWLTLWILYEFIKILLLFLWEKLNWLEWCEQWSVKHAAWFINQLLSIKVWYMYNSNEEEQASIVVTMIFTQ